MRIIITLILLVSVLSPLFSTPLPATADCQFTLGFKKLHDQIPTVVGDCLEDAHFDTGSAETLQATTGTRTDGGFGGLLVWRKADNLTFFTDGTNTWIDSPRGVQKRPNTQRFPWELETLQNAAYNLQNIPFVLNQGSATLSADQPRVIRLFAALDENNLAYGDLNGDGLIDAAARIVINTGGSGSFNYLVAMVSSVGLVQQAASLLLGDRVIVNSISISDGTITVDMIVQGPNDPLCCPTQPKIANFRLINGQLTELVK